jgi:MFS family permease
MATIAACSLTLRHLQVAEMGYVFTARSVGYLFGSMVGGPLFDRLDGNKLLAVALGLTVIGTGACSPRQRPSTPL